MKDKNKLWLLAGIGTVIGYRAIKGKGIFNNLRFKKQRSALLGYTDTHFPGAKIGEVFAYKEGWGSFIFYQNSRYLIYIIPSQSGGYIFTQTEM